MFAVLFGMGRLVGRLVHNVLLPHSQARWFAYCLRVQGQRGVRPSTLRTFAVVSFVGKLTDPDVTIVIFSPQCVTIPTEASGDACRGADRGASSQNRGWEVAQWR